MKPLTHRVIFWTAFGAIVGLIGLNLWQRVQSTSGDQPGWPDSGT